MTLKIPAMVVMQAFFMSPLIDVYIKYKYNAAIF